MVRRGGSSRRGNNAGGASSSALGAATGTGETIQIGRWKLREDQQRVADRAFKVVKEKMSVIISADAGWGKSAVAAALLQLLRIEYHEKRTLNLTLFENKRLAFENYTMFGLTDDLGYVTVKAFNDLNNGTRLNGNHHAIGASFLNFFKILGKKEDDENGIKECDLEKWIRLYEIDVLILTIDEVHVLHIQNTILKCERLAHIRSRLEELEVKMIVIGVSATPTVHLPNKESKATKNAGNLYGLEDYDTKIIVKLTDAELTKWQETRWQGTPTNAAFQESHILRLDSGEHTKLLHDFVLLTALFCNPTADDTFDEDGYDPNNWIQTNDISGRSLVVHNDLLEMLHVDDLRRKDRKTAKGRTTLHVPDDEQTEELFDEHKFHNQYFKSRIDGKYFIPKPLERWNSCREQCIIRRRLESFINLLEVRCFVNSKFEVGTVGCISRLLPLHNLGTMYRVVTYDGTRVTEKEEGITTGGCIIMYVPTVSGQLEMRKAMQDSEGDEVLYYDLTGEHRQSVSYKKDKMLHDASTGTLLHVGLISKQLTMGTNFFAKNVQGVLVVGGHMDETRKKHLNGRIARAEPAVPGDIYMDTPYIEHARNKMLSNLQAAMEHGTAPTEPNNTWVEAFHKAGGEEKEWCHFCSLFDPETNEPFAVWEHGNLAKDYLKAIPMRRDHHQKIINGEDLEDDAWTKKLGKLQELMDDVRKIDKDNRKVLNQVPVRSTSIGCKRVRE